MPARKQAAASIAASSADRPSIDFDSGPSGIFKGFMPGRVKLLGMDKQKIADLLQKVKEQKISVEEAMEALRRLPYEDLGFAKIDHQRQLQKGFPEVIYCPGKTEEQIVEIIGRLEQWGALVLATRAELNVYEAVRKVFPTAEYHERCRMLVVRPPGVPLPAPEGKIVVMAAGTADIPVADEAALTAALMGGRVVKIYDIGVAGIHRLFDHWTRIKDARVIVAVAGMEGALPSVVGGMVACPVIAVPTSVGYGAHFDGLAPLLSMLNSCASGVAVVNVDNGFGAGYTAALINRIGDRK